MCSSDLVSRPEIYYGETGHEPIFVPTSQPEFNYPSGSAEVNTNYDGKGGFAIGSQLARLIATVAYSDWNIVLSNSIKDNTRMMVHRSVLDRLNTLADFITWDSDPYIVIGDNGRLTWMVDGYTTSDRFPTREAFRPSAVTATTISATVSRQRSMRMTEPCTCMSSIKPIR